jgi:hypothetical protein
MTVTNNTVIALFFIVLGLIIIIKRYKKYVITNIAAIAALIFIVVGIIMIQLQVSASADFDILTPVVMLISIVIGATIAVKQIAVSATIAEKQSEASNKVKKAEFFHQIIDRLRFDDDIVQATYKIEYKEWFYNKDFHHNNTNFEFKLDKLLFYLSYICYLKKTENIDNNEFENFQYIIKRVCEYHDVQCYLWNIHHFSDEQNKQCSFKPLIDYSIEEGIISQEDFYNENCSRYERVIPKEGLK